MTSKVEAIDARQLVIDDYLVLDGVAYRVTRITENGNRLSAHYATLSSKKGDLKDNHKTFWNALGHRAQRLTLGAGGTTVPIYVSSQDDLLLALKRANGGWVTFSGSDRMLNAFLVRLVDLGMALYLHDPTGVLPHRAAATAKALALWKREFNHAD